MVGLALLIACPSHAQAAAAKAADAAAWSKEIAPLLTDQILAVVRVDVASINLDAAVKPLDDAAKKAGEAKVSDDPEFAKAKEHLTTLQKSGAKVMYVLADESSGSDQPLIAITLGAKADTAAIAELLEVKLVKPDKISSIGRFEKGAVENKGMLLVSSRSVLERTLKAKPAARPDVTKAFAAANGAPVTIAFVPPKAKMQEAMHMLPSELPEELGGGSTASLGQMEWLCITIGLPPKMSLNFTIQCENAAAAKGLKTLIDTLLAAAEDKIDLVPGPMKSWAEMLLGTMKDLNFQAKSSAVVGGLNDKQMSSMFVKIWSLYAEAKRDFGGYDDDDDDVIYDHN